MRYFLCYNVFMSKKSFKKDKPKRSYKTKTAVIILTILGTGLLVYFLVVAYNMDVLSNPEKLKEVLSKSGYFAPLIYALFQAFQILIPMIPGIASTAYGSVMFGLWYGLLINLLVGIPCMLINFYLAKKYGWVIISKIFGKKQQKTIKKWITLTPDKLNHIWFFKIVHKVISDKNYKKMIVWLSKKNGFYEMLTFITMLLPIFPADLLCYAYGLTDIKERDFFWILVITRPFNILSLGLIANGMIGVF